MTPVLLDGGDKRCVLLLIELRKLIATLEPEAVVHLRATDPAAPLDLPAWCHLTGHEYLGVIFQDIYGVRVKKAAVETDPRQPWRAIAAE
ncbi:MULTISPECIES: sulfurtransferase TusA family protein [Actinoplanes]|uniref:sulfurtransferase TusA family protein n=1 Tax=Actinoplanes TaxID=1865 RepID=UPI0005F2B18E|nr:MULTISPECIES: sulfurtransferase TusA family protein [Actinoplanes]GLY06393.1 hypothetical protein Acsp01_67720 [Actinoplanes sp. NBRC 101535]